MNTNRVVITGIQPSIDNGAYRAKALINEDIPLSASIFADGHDEIAASVFIKHEHEKLTCQKPKSNNKTPLSFKR